MAAQGDQPGESQGAVLLAPPVERAKELNPVSFDRHYEEKYAHPIRKALSFCLSEGLRMTVRKFRSKRIERRIESSISIVIAVVVLDGRRFVGFTRRLGDRLVFHLGLLFRLPPDRALEEVQLPSEAGTLLESYLPVPSCPLPERIPSLIQVANPFLNEIENPALMNRFSLTTLERTSTRESVRSNVIDEAATSIRKVARPDRTPGVFLLGFGSYVREYVLPHFNRRIAAAVDYKAEPINRYISPMFPVVERLGDVEDELARQQRPLVIISAFHSDHASLALHVLRINPGACVFIEKPLAVQFEDIEKLARARRNGAWIDVGYNRRYAPLTWQLREGLRGLSGPLVLTISVKELKLPETHWYFWPNQGTRITGNVCHWIDLVWHLAGSAPQEISLLNTGDSIALSFLFEDGSLSNITATDLGDDLAGVEERIEARRGRTTISLYDYRRMHVRSETGRTVVFRVRRDKGHDRMYADLKRRWLRSVEPRYPPADMQVVGYLTHTAAEMLQSGTRSRCVDPDLISHTR